MNGNENPQVSLAALKPVPQPWLVTGIVCTLNPMYPPQQVFGAGGPPGSWKGYPAPEQGPVAIPPGCAPGLPNIVFAGPWQPYPASAHG